ncbi:hypothetical protein ABW21_db0209275 [Orbilia brochopaga]|nr:hypothetical protein ABW21_db0209275 [Drechslerella brochopaga]
MSDSGVIRDIAVTCRKSLERCLGSPRLRENGWAENRLVDFNLWSEGAGVLATGKLSLDERLSSKPEARKIISNLLSLMNMFIEDCLEKVDKSINQFGYIANSAREESKYNGTEYKDNETTITSSQSEAEAKKDVEETLNQIVRLTVAIRKAGSSARLTRADRSFDKQDPTIQKLTSFLELVIHPRGTKLDGLNEIQTRLIEANLRRRHRFNYARLHSQRLAKRDADSQLQSQPAQIIMNIMMTKTPPQIEEPPSQPDKEMSTEIPNIQSQRSDIEPPVQAPTVTTAASAIEGTVIINESKTSQKRRAAVTILSRITSGIKYPRPPPVSPYKIRKHLAGDIIPYTCIFTDCSRPLQLYLSRGDWEHHIKTEHGHLWNCIVCDQLGDFTKHEFYQERDIIEHINLRHRDDVDIDEISMFVSASYSSKLTDTDGCPICPGPKEGQDLLEHIARCVHDFSLRSLPAPSESDGPGDYFDIDSGGISSADIASSSEDEGRDIEGLPPLEFETGQNSDTCYTELTESSLQMITQPILQDHTVRLQEWLLNCNDPEDLDERGLDVESYRDKEAPPDRKAIYKVGWICTELEDLDAALAALDHIEKMPYLEQGNRYALGVIGHYNVVILQIPAADIDLPQVLPTSGPSAPGVGASDATKGPASPVRHMLRSFPSIRAVLFVGTAGGVPPLSKLDTGYTITPSEVHPDVRLGDVVVGTAIKGFPAVAEVNSDSEGRVESYTDLLGDIPFSLHPISSERILGRIDEMGLNMDIRRPNGLIDRLHTFDADEDISYDLYASVRDVFYHSERSLAELSHGVRLRPPDYLFRPDYDHNSRAPNMRGYCEHCDLTMTLRRATAGQLPKLQVHHGMIFSMERNPKPSLRDEINKTFDCEALCIGVRESGLLENIPHIDIRGISNYLDSHEYGNWKPHASFVAAAYATELLKNLGMGELGKYTVNELIHLNGEKSTTSSIFRLWEWCERSL